MAAEEAGEVMQMQRPGDKGFALLHKDLKQLRKQLGEGGIRHEFGHPTLANRGALSVNREYKLITLPTLHQ